MTKYLNTLKNNIEGLSIESVLEFLYYKFPGEVTFSTSFSYEDQVITDLIFRSKPEIEIFTLDTGRLFPETYDVWQRTNQKYNTGIKAYSPRHRNVEGLLQRKGPYSFYESVENRKECCFIRKVEPLKRAIRGKKVWITGIRAEHSSDRQSLEKLEWDENNNIIKYNPILDWTEEEVTSYIEENNIPFNILHKKGFVSIGCAPCTRAIQPGEHFRAGRWWWEEENKKECGLHS